MKVLVAFGDSWTFGSELDRPQEQSWPVVLAKQLHSEHLNLGTPASSVGHLMIQLFSYIKQQDKYTDYKKIFMVGLTGTTRYLSYSNDIKEFVSITPEANYRTVDIHPSGRPPDIVESMRPVSNAVYKHVQDTEYDNFLVAQTVFAFQNYCKLHDIDCVFFSYFDHPDLSAYKLDPIHNQTITKELTGKEYCLPDIRNNIYFEGKLFHPNLHGHSKIADILHDLYTKKYTRD
jgi:hypothetical protein